MKGIKITIEEVELPVGEDKADLELAEKAKVLSAKLKEHYNIDIFSREVQFILTMFKQVFRPLLQNFQKDESTIFEIAAALKKYATGWENLTSVFLYAEDRHDVNMAESPYDDMIIAKSVEIVDTVWKMREDGKSLEDAYRYLVKMRTSYIEEPKGAVN